MFSQALHTARGGWGCLTPSQRCFAAFAANRSTIALSPASFYLATACQCACLPPALLSLPKQKGWLITPSCCMPITYYYSCFVYKKRTGEKLRRVPGNVCGFGTSVKDLCPRLPENKKMLPQSLWTHQKACLFSEWCAPATLSYMTCIKHRVSRQQTGEEKFGLVRWGGSYLC